MKGIFGGLRLRVMIYLSLGLILLFGLLGFFSWQVIEQMSRQVHEERLALARTLAGRVDNIMAQAKKEMELEGDEMEALKEYPQALLASLARLRQRLLNFGLALPHAIILYDLEGRQLAADLPLASVENPPSAILLPALSRREATLGEGEVEGHPLAALAVPVKGGALFTYLFPKGLEGELPLQDPQQRNSYFFEVTDGKGRAVISAPYYRGPFSGHWALLPELTKNPAGGTAIHRVEEKTGAESHIVAYYPMASLPWGVTIEQALDEAFFIPHQWQRRLLLFGSLSLAFSLVVTWIATSRLVNPIKALTRASQRIASGDLSHPVPSSAPDELGALARNFEEMRRQLQASWERLEGWSHELEERLKERTAELEQRHRELEEKEGQRRKLLDKVITAQEEERRRVARELHDEIGQVLTAITLNLGSIEAGLPEEQEKARAQLAGLRELTSRELDEVRRLISDLRPTVLDDMGLEAALRWYVDTYLSKAGVEATVEVSGMEGRLPPSLEVALFRVVQEGVNNIIKHSGATRATVSLGKTDTGIKAAIQDNGTGLSPQARTGFGLMGMAERVELLGGTFKLNSSPGEGTRLEVFLPVSFNEEGYQRDGKDQGVHRR